MVKDRSDSAGKKKSYSVKQPEAKAADAHKIHGEFPPDKRVGAGQNAFGGAKDTVGDAIKH